ncbi:DNA topology modulation protein [Oceanobacillus kapialis]|uniref:DNA topology modulation protein n=1 Tax=Oceanobacillus kapialis TaxID=481353 RepID=UPI00384C920F
MLKIAIIGCGGAGKSTLAKKLGKILNIPVYHLDSIFWKPGWQPIERDELIEKTMEIQETNQWIIDGNYGSTMDLRLQQADTVIFLHYSTIRCLYGIVKRRIQYHNKTRPDMGEDCKERLDWEFFNWVRTYNQKKSPQVLKRLSTLKETKIHIFTSPKQLEHFLKELKVKTNN